MEPINISFFIISFSSLFALINPLGISPILLSITENLNNEEYNKTIKKGIFFATILLLIFACMGEVIFKFYGITIHAFKIAGGILFFRTGTNMLHAKTPRTRTTPKETLEASEIEDISIAPIGIPIIAGPGAITSVMLLSHQAVSFYERVFFYFNIIFVLLLTYYILKVAKKISKKFGTTWIRIIQRIMGLILMVLAIQFIINGIDPIVKSWIALK
tara:strand:- start:168 stop:815 length:648 start_codon:yes stop_codon:yes gene_type:complete